MKKCIVFVGGLLSLFPISNASALTYSQDVPVSFTFNRSISVSVSSDLHIYNLTPGMAADSNVITVSVATNNITGYVLTASVGNSTHSNPSYNNTNLNHTNGSTFTTVATNASLASLTTDNTWGYSISTNDGSTWSNYSGLPLYTAANWKELANVNGNGTTSLKFKIGAKASSAQPSGDYTNVINFTAVGNAVPMSISDAYADAGKTQYNGYYKMQDMNSTICSNVEVTGESSQTQLIDARDGKVYYVAKLADGNCWMTQNLDHDIVTTANFYTYYNTDIGHGSTPNTSATWTASTATHATSHTSWWDVAAGRTESYDPGDLCWGGTVGNATTTSCAQSGNHYHLGNYYHWAAAIAVNDSTIYTTDNTDVNQSICPAGWMLPKSGSNTSSGSFAYLVNQASLTAGASGNIHSSPYYFVYSTDWEGQSFQGMGNYGYYWSSMVYSGHHPYGLIFNANYSYLDPSFTGSGGHDSEDGFSVRCAAR